MSQSKIAKLTKYLMDARYQGRKLANDTEFKVYVEQGVIIPASKKINGNGLLAARLYYSSVISIDPCFAPAELISAYVSFWLQNNGEGEDSQSAEFSSTVNDDNSFEIEISIATFEEKIELIESADGPFELDEKRYDFGEQSLWIAEAFTLSGDVEKC